MKRVFLLGFFVSFPAFAQDNSAFEKALHEFEVHFKKQSLEMEEKKRECMNLVNDVTFCTCVVEKAFPYTPFSPASETIRKMTQHCVVY